MSTIVSPSQRAQAAAATTAPADRTAVDIPTPLANELEKEIPAADRLAESRRRLRDAMMTIAHPPEKPPIDWVGDPGEVVHGLLARARQWPGAELVLETLESWWRQHPLRTASTVAEEATRTFVAPLARQNPLAAVAGAFGVGALLMLSRPWRWLIRPALVIGLVSQLAKHAVRRVPADSVLRMVSGTLSKSARRRSARATAAGAAAARSAAQTGRARTAAAHAELRDPA